MSALLSLLTHIPEIPPPLLSLSRGLLGDGTIPFTEPWRDIMKLGELIGKVFSFTGRALDSTEKLFDITDNLLDTAIAVSEDTKQDVLVDLKANNALRDQRLKDLGIH